MAMQRLVNFSDEVTEERSNVWVEEERVERGGWWLEKTEVWGW